MNHSFCVGRERRKTDVGQVAIPEGSSSVFFRWQRLFDAPSRFFHPGSPSKIVSTPYIYRDELPILITHFWLSTFDSSCLLLVSSPSNH